MRREVCFGQLVMSRREDVSVVKGRVCDHRCTIGVERLCRGDRRKLAAAREGEEERRRTPRGWGSTERRRREGSAATQCGQNDVLHRAREENGWRAKRRGGGKKALLGEANSHGNLVEMET